MVPLELVVTLGFLRRLRLLQRVVLVQTALFLQLQI
jgi:hypothetical protein